MTHATPPNTVALASDIVAAYVAHNSLPRAELPGLIARVHDAISEITIGKAALPEPAPLKPAVPIRNSLTDEYVICLEDGKRFKSLKRHLAASYGMTPEDYRKKWTLPKDYPMVAPAYSNARSALAKRVGLGRASTEARPAPEQAAEHRAGASTLEAEAPRGGDDSQRV